MVILRVVKYSPKSHKAKAPSLAGSVTPDFLEDEDDEETGHHRVHYKRKKGFKNYLRRVGR